MKVLLKSKYITVSLHVLIWGMIMLTPFFIANAHNKVNNLPLGRNVDEALRMVEALQFTEKHGEVCPANWTQGEKSMKPNQEGLKAYFGS